MTKRFKLVFIVEDDEWALYDDLEQALDHLYKECPKQEDG